ncbi:MAG: AAA family ATPase [Elusimicrobia bacterium]|nr:AAA family ATPase [Elusimicrobiota bacterium]
MKKTSLALKTITLLTSITFLFTTLASPFAEASLFRPPEDQRSTIWQQRKRTARGHIEPLALSPSERSPSPLSFETGLPIPQSAGATTESFWPSLAFPAAASPMVIHIQDAHGVYAAQRNAARILEALAENSHEHASGTASPLLVAVEGAWGPVDTRWLSTFPDKNLRNRISENFLQSGQITGEEYLSVTSDEPVIQIVGVEDPDLYRANNAAKEAVQSERTRVLDYLSQLSKRVDTLKQSVYPPSLFELDRLTQSHSDQRLSLASYTQGMKNLWNGRFPAHDYPNLTHLLQTTSFENRFPRQALEKELQSFLSALDEKLPESALTSLLSQAAELRQGQLSPRVFYEGIIHLAGQMAAAPPLPLIQEYVRYLAEREQIDTLQLLQELEHLRRVLADRLLETETSGAFAKTLSHADKWVSLKKRLWSLEMSPQEWTAYRSDASRLTWSNIESSLMELEAKKGIAPKPTSDRNAIVSVVQRVEPVAEHFYELALRRNHALAQNALREAHRRGANRVVLITGGFHTPGLTRILRRQGTSYLVVMPRFELEGPSRGTLREMSRFGTPSGRQELQAQVLSILQLILPPAEAEHLAGEMLRTNPDEHANLKGIEWVPQVIAQGDERILIGAIQGHENRRPFIVSYQGQGRPEFVVGDEAVLEWLSQRPVKSLSEADRRRLSRKMESVWLQFHKAHRPAINAFWGLKRSPYARLSVITRSWLEGLKESVLRHTPARVKPAIARVPAWGVAIILLILSAAAYFGILEPIYQYLAHGIGPMSSQVATASFLPASKTAAGVIQMMSVVVGLVIKVKMDGKDQETDTYDVAFKQPIDKQIAILSQLLSDEKDEPSAAAEEIFQLILSFSSFRAGEIYMSLGEAQKRKLLDKFSADTIGRILNGVDDYVPQKQINDWAWRLGEINAEVPELEELFSGYSLDENALKSNIYLDELSRKKNVIIERLTGNLHIADTSKRLSGVEDKKGELNGLEEFIVEYRNYENTIYHPEIVAGVQKLAKERLAEAEQDLRTRRDLLTALQKEKDPARTLELLRLRLAAMIDEKQRIDKKLIAMQRPDLTHPPETSEQNRKHFIAMKANREIDFIREHLYQWDDNTQNLGKLNHIGVVYRAAQAVSRRIAARSLIDVTSIVHSTFNTPEASPPDLVETREAVNHTLRAIRQTRSPAVSLSLPWEGSEIHFRDTLVRRLLTDDALRPTLKRQKVVYVDLWALHESLGPDKFFKDVKTILLDASEMGDVTLIINLDDLSKILHIGNKDEVSLFDDILLFWQHLEHPPSLIALASEQTQRNYINRSKVFSTVFENHSTNLTLPSTQNLLQRIAEAAEKRNGLRVAADIVGRLVETIRETRMFNLPEAVRALEWTAAARQLNQPSEEPSKEITWPEVRSVIEESASENLSLERRIRDQLDKLPIDVQVAITSEKTRLDNMNPTDAERGMVVDYIDTLLRLPWPKATESEAAPGSGMSEKDIKEIIRKRVETARAILDKGHYGLEKVKERILKYIEQQENQRLMGKKLTGDVLCFSGPPGVGKTSIGAAIAEATERKFVRVPMGGVDDTSEITGHTRTYTGALPGRIIQAILEAGTDNVVIFLDEVDKIQQGFAGDPRDALLDVLHAANNAFHDLYVDLPYDLSRVLFIATVNNPENLPGPFRNRLEMIQLDGYKDDDKVEIAARHLLPDLMKEMGLTDNQVAVFDDDRRIRPEMMDALRLIVQDYDREPGVRSLKRLLRSLLQKAYYQKTKERVKDPIVLNREKVKQFLGAPKAYDKVRDEQSWVPGEVIGLAWTQEGGETLTIQTDALAASADEETTLDITGNIQDEMRVSADTALEAVRHLSSGWGLTDGDFDNVKFHLHVPDMAIPKDGPSAGVTIATSLLSSRTGRRVRGDVAMTGEVDKFGRVSAIGGLQDKLLAAQRAGVKTVFIPKENQDALRNIYSTTPRLRGITEEKGVQQLFVPRKQSRENATPAERKEVEEWGTILTALRGSVSALHLKLAEETPEGLSIVGDKDAVQALLKKHPQIRVPMTVVLVDHVEEIWRQALMAPQAKKNGFARADVLIGLSALLLAVLFVAPTITSFLHGAPFLSLDTAALLGGWGDGLQTAADWLGNLLSPKHQGVMQSGVSMLGAGIFAMIFKTSAGSEINVYETAFTEDTDAQANAIAELLMEDTPESLKTAETICRLALGHPRAFSQIGRIFLIFKQNPEYYSYYKKAFLSFSPVVSGKILFAIRHDLKDAAHEEYKTQIASEKQILERLKPFLEKPAKLATLIETERETMLAHIKKLTSEIEGENAVLERSIRNAGGSENAETRANLLDQNRAMLAGLSGIAERLVKKEDLPSVLPDYVRIVERHIKHVQSRAYDFAVPMLSQEFSLKSTLYESFYSTTMFLHLTDIVAILDAEPATRPKIDVLISAYLSHLKLAEHYRTGLLTDLSQSKKDDSSLSDLKGAYHEAVGSALTVLGTEHERVMTMVTSLKETRTLMPSLVASRILEDAGLPPVHKSYRVLYLDVTKLPASREEAVPVVLSILAMAQNAGDMLLLMDMDEFCIKLGQQSAKALDLILSRRRAIMNQRDGVRGAGDLQPLPIVFFSSEESHATMRDLSSDYDATSRVHVLKQDDESHLLSLEIRRMEAGNNIHFHKDAAAHLHTQLKSNKWDYQHALSVAQRAAGTADRDNQPEITKNDLDLASDVLDNEKKVRLSQEQYFRQKIRSLPKHIKEAANAQLGRLLHTANRSSLWNNITTYLKWLVDLPWPSGAKEEPKTDDEIEKATQAVIQKAEAVLERDHHGLSSIKKGILEYIAINTRQRMLGIKTTGKILCFVGPPGVGKTTLAQSIADATDSKLAKISLGGLSNNAELLGFRRTYVGAIPGRIIRAIKKAASPKRVLLFDEVDKMGRGQHGDPSNALIHILDPDHNNAYKDHYLDVPYDLSNDIIIVTANDLEKIPKPILDRLEVIHFREYTEDEKVEIGRRMISRLRSELGINEDRVKIANIGAVVRKVLKYTQEPGVRQLEKLIKSLLRKAFDEWVFTDEAGAIDVTPESVPKYLGVPSATAQIREDGTVEPGEAIVPGEKDDLLFVQASLRRDAKSRRRISLKTASHLGKEFRESFQLALNLVERKMPHFGLDPDSVKGVTVAMHLSGQASAADAPRIVMAAVASLYSVLTARAVRRDSAFFGELDLKGNVLLAKESLTEKIRAASEAGVKTLFIPLKNQADLANDTFISSPDLRGIVEVASTHRQTLFIPKKQAQDNAGKEETDEVAQWNAVLQKLMKALPAEVAVKNASDEGVTFEGPKSDIQALLAANTWVPVPMTYVLVENIEELTLGDFLTPAASPQAAAPKPGAAPKQTKVPSAWLASLIFGGLITAAAVWQAGLPGLLAILLIPGRVWYVLMARQWPQLTPSMQKEVGTKIAGALAGRFGAVTVFSNPGDTPGTWNLLTMPYRRLQPLAYVDQNVLYLHHSVAFALSEHNRNPLTRAIAEALVLHEMADHGTQEWKGDLGAFALGRGLQPLISSSPLGYLLRTAINLSNLPQMTWDLLGLLKPAQTPSPVLPGNSLLTSLLIYGHYCRDPKLKSAIQQYSGMVLVHGFNSAKDGRDLFEQIRDALQSPSEVPIPSSFLTKEKSAEWNDAYAVLIHFFGSPRLPGPNFRTPLSRLSETLLTRRADADQNIPVVAFDWRSLDAEWGKDLLSLMRTQMESAEKSGEGAVQFAFVSDESGLTPAQMAEILAGRFGLGSLAARLLCVDRATLEKENALSDQNIILVDRLVVALRKMNGAGAIQLRVVVDSVNARRWQGQALQVLLTKTDMEVVVAGDSADQIRTAIRQSYPAEEAERILRDMEGPNGSLRLPASKMDPKVWLNSLTDHLIFNIQA